jgi:hypothetical protein
MKYFVPAVLVLFGACALIGCSKKPLTPAVAVSWTNDEVGVATSPALGLAGGKAVVCIVCDAGSMGHQRRRYHPLEVGERADVRAQ